ncbi:Cyclin-dependent kinases regulatory subunit 1 [Micractinium conductrix]|uniref:Cyclin-dependent kinases regulatory subunit n=1 Tax=Micractinium conductrix TaxID=554055 RepID=A0A2P6VC11_9CHLO|nr:Cyclin-dependent kinases regulatory subunit 1 [Micractinium conductrix]|eukprot:PSC71618.1 Cyclin-dependent kinases regulatory subunit 1 [Micractinium conductrix]
MAANGIQYSERYYDDVYEYRHVVLPQDIAKRLPKDKLLSEAEWRALGVQQSRGWVHYARHRPEVCWTEMWGRPHIMLFRRPKGYGTAQQVAVPMQQ